MFTVKFGDGMSFPPSGMHIAVKIAPVRAYFLNYANWFYNKDLGEYQEGRLEKIQQASRGRCARGG